MDVSDHDIINRYYVPCEHLIKQCLVSSTASRTDVLISFIDVTVTPHSLKDGRKAIVITDQLIDEDLCPAKKILRLPDSIFGIYFIPDILYDAPVQRDFNLFMNRANVHRLFWFYKAIEMNWLDTGFVSYIGSTQRSPQPNLSPSQYIDHLHQQYFSPLYDCMYNFARKSVPYQNFQDHGDLRDQMIRSKVSVVIETYHERSDAIAFSEKIFRALQVPRPWVLSAATGSVKRLRNLGFDVFDDYIDHGYDSLCTKFDISRRDDMIFDQVRRMKDFVVSDSVLHDWNQRYRKNLTILQQWNQTWKKDLSQFLHDNFQIISNIESLA